MILAAGLGTRLRPLTQNTPKALIVVHGIPLIAYSLHLLKKHGIKEVLINLHYLGEVIEKEIGNGSKFGMKITYSWEEKLLGTGGGIKKAAPFFGNKTFLLLNSDVLIDLDLRELIKFHRSRKGLATMVVRKPQEENSYTPLLLSPRRRIMGFDWERKEARETFIYTGAQVLDPKFLDYLPENQESCLIRQGYEPAITAGEKVYGFPYEGYWNDLGTLERYRQAEDDLNSGKVKFSFIRT